MKRLEIIANASVEESLFEAFRARGVAQFYTKVPVVHGVGSSGPRHAQEAGYIREAVDAVKEKFPDEGLKLCMIEESSFP